MKETKKQVTLKELIELHGYTVNEWDNCVNEFCNNFEFQRTIIFNFVNCVYVFDDKIIIYYNLFNNKK